MKTTLILTFGLGLTAATVGGLWLAGESPSAVPSSTPTTTTQRAAVTPVTPDSQSTAPETMIAEAPTTHRSISELRHAFVNAKNPAERESIAAALADQNQPEAIQALIEGIKQTPEWSTRASLAKHLRAVSDPATLEALLPALLDTYGRGNTIFREISDTVARLAQADTVETLEVMHWQASAQAGQGHKILRTVAEIRNPPARRALQKLALHAESPALAAAAEAALVNLPQ